MQEKIGNVILDYQFYCGKDIYSDGPIEDRLLGIAKMQLDDYSKLIYEKNDWSILYHFSNIRKNIIDWLPIDKTQTVLEIGSGCGAITGGLATKAKHVDCIELSKKRSHINANRNSKFDNITIQVGNFQDIEKNMTDKYDYITLIGVFEYSEAYINAKYPFQEMLSCIKTHLKTGGKIVIAIENRLGMKYWAGCTEDHNGLFFEGLEGYTNTNGVKTFSRNEILNIIESAGELTPEFYYPYPDYKFPLCIYSDDFLPKRGELHNNMCNMDRSRIVLFDETKVYDTLIAQNKFADFSNSFLILLERS